MPYPPIDYNICPCCGTEFGLDDVGVSPAELRSEWLDEGAPWFSDELSPEPNWNPFVQLAMADLEYDRAYEPDSADNTYSAAAVA